MSATSRILYNQSELSFFDKGETRRQSLVEMLRIRMHMIHWHEFHQNIHHTFLLSIFDEGELKVFYHTFITFVNVVAFLYSHVLLDYQ